MTVKSLAGRLTQRIGSVTFEKGTASVKAIDVSQMTAQQTEAIGPVEENASLVVLKQDERQTPTVIAHNGEEGQLIRGRGALSFRIGDFFSGKDTEQMRLTAEGNLGIGFTHPQARLDVDGLIRTSHGIVFPDGSIQTTAAFAGNAGQTPDQNSPGGELLRSANKNKSSAKGAKGSKGFSPELFVSEDLTVNGNIIFTPSQQAMRDITVQTNFGGLRFYGAPFPLTNSPAAAAIQFWGNNSLLPGQLYLDSGAHDSGAVIIRTTGTGGTITERMRVTSTGNIGIGVTGPVRLLHIGANNSVGGIRVEGPLVGGTGLSSFSMGGLGSFGIDAVNIVGGRFLVREDGNIGIGTTAPQDKLDVRGNIKLGISGQLYAPGSEENLRIIRGVIGKNGDIIAGSGFHVQHPESGVYFIYFDTPFAGLPSVVAMPDLGVEWIRTYTFYPSVFTLHMIDDKGFYDSSPFSFIAIGPR